MRHGIKANLPIFDSIPCVMSHRCEIAFKLAPQFLVLYAENTVQYKKVTKAQLLVLTKLSYICSPGCF